MKCLIKLAVLIIVLNLADGFTYQRTVRSSDICGYHNGHRKYLELGESGQLSATNITVPTVCHYWFSQSLIRLSLSISDFCKSLLQLFLSGKSFPFEVLNVFTYLQSLVHSGGHQEVQPIADLALHFGARHMSWLHYQAEVQSHQFSIELRVAEERRWGLSMRLHCAQWAAVRLAAEHRVQLRKSHDLPDPNAIDSD